MKTNHIYIIVAVVIIILGFAFLNRGNTTKGIVDETNNQTVSESISTSTNTQKATQSNTASGKQKPTSPQSNTNTSMPGQISIPVREPIPSIPTLSSLSGSTFRMTSYNGNSVPTDSKYSLSFEEGSLSAKFCNSMSGNFVLDGSLIKVSNLLSTMMYCATPSNLMEIESAFASMLGFGARIYQSGNTIILSDSKGAVMVFTGF